MAITSSYMRLVIQQGTSFGATFSILNEDGTTFSNLSDWEATFEIFNADGMSLYKWSSATSANVDTGLWTRLGAVIPGEDTTDFAYNGYVELPKEITSAMNDWGVGHFDFDFIDPFGHVQLRYHDEIVLEEGTKHSSGVVPPDPPDPPMAIDGGMPGSSFANYIDGGTTHV